MKKDASQKPLSNLEAAEFFHQMHRMLEAGISVPEGLSLLLADAQSEEEALLLTQLMEKTETENSFFKAASDVGVFPSYALHMMHLGEESGTLDRVMKGLWEHYSREENLAAMLRSSLIYPAVMLGMMALIILVLLTRVLPIFNQVFLQLGQTMQGLSAGLLALGNTLSRYFVLFLSAAVLIVIFLFLFRKHLPLYQRLRKQRSLCRFADGMSIALKSGLTAEAALTLSAELTEDDVFQKKVSTCQNYLNEGLDLGSALHQSDIFSGGYARMALIASKTGRLDEAMSEISSAYEYALYNRINSLLAALEPTLVIVLSLIVGVILFSVMLPLLGIMSGLS